MGLRVRRQGPLSTTVVVGRLVGTFEPARVIVTIAQAKSASASANTIAPSQPAGTVAGTNGKGISQLSASPANTATAHAIGGLIMTFAVSVVSAMARTIESCTIDSFRFGQCAIGVASGIAARPFTDDCDSFRSGHAVRF